MRVFAFMVPTVSRTVIPFLVATALSAQLPAADTEVETIDLWPEGVPGLHADAKPTRVEDGRYFDIHYPDMFVRPPASEKANGTAVVYAPGGGYERVAAGSNGGEIASWLTGLGVTVFELHYRHKAYGHPAPLQDALRAMRIVRSRAAEFGVQPDRIGMLGGSAGGHVATCAATLYDAPEGKTGAALDAVSARPDFVILIFPVVSMLDPYGRGGSRRNLLGDDPSPGLKELLSTELHVTRESSPAFIVSSQQDRSVPAENSIQYYQAMCRAGAPGELHLFAKGPHGSGLDPRFGPISDWPELCERWMRFNGWLPASP